MKTLFTSAFLLTVALSAAPVHADADRDLTRIFSEFDDEWTSLNVPDLQLGYADNFAAIQSLAGIAQQESVLLKYQAKLATIGRAQIRDIDLGYRFDQLAFEIGVGLERVTLERRFRSGPGGGQIPTAGLIHAPDASEWYRLYAKRWTSSFVTPDQMRALGISEVERVTRNIQRLQSDLGFAGDDARFYAHLNDASFIITDEAELLHRLEAVRNQAMSRLGNDFSVVDIPLVGVTPVPSPTKDTPPGYYEDGTFYYNFYQGRFRSRALSWLFMHEAVPGHHYQKSIEARTSVPAFSNRFWYPGFSEGWGAYAEDLGEDFGFFDDPYQELGKWEWDLVRSARVVIDVGLNYDGWTRDEAMAYWHTHVPNQDDIADREIDRIMRWPLQVASYKVGERCFLDLREEFKRRQGDAFDIKQFHDVAIRRGNLPLDVVRRIVADAVSSL